MVKAVCWGLLLTPSRKKKTSKLMKTEGYQGDEELFVNITCVLGGSDCVNKEPGNEEHADGLKYYSQVLRAGISTHGLELHFAPHRINHKGSPPEEHIGRSKCSLL